MVKITIENIVKYIKSDAVPSMKRKLESFRKVFKPLHFTSGDMIYKRMLVRKYIPDLYDRHTIEKYTNCAFCTHLVRSSCQKYCLKCSKGIYIQSSLLLPGILSCEEKGIPNQSVTSTPWYFRNTCYYFDRLPAYRYLKNFKVFMSSITIYNYEVLEGLIEGISGNEKPCFVCASTDYEIYKKCCMQGDLDKKTPCSRINSEIASIYLKTG
jgi:hypothetical protein